ncbi:unnamed protein product [Tuber aestivum]|uniref:Uncharacterized protein n=1 Tax=Tuber aestivum TaxID=59557 RepID=A0A292Q9D3_9PEZI|nr:unnamed protein product [Tuber aestivum]
MRVVIQFAMRAVSYNYFSSANPPVWFSYQIVRCELREAFNIHD